MTRRAVQEECRLLLQSRSKILQQRNPVGLWHLAKNPEMLLNFVTFNSSSDSGGLGVFECVMLNCKGHQTVALSFPSSFFLVSGKWGHIS